MDNNTSWHSRPEAPIEFQITRYYDNGEGLPPKERYTHAVESRVFLSVEELDLICTIAHEMSDQYDWPGQLKKRRK
jgi:hypothetical protein